MRNNVNNYHERTPVQHLTDCQVPLREPKDQGNGERKPNLTFEKNHNNPRTNDSASLSVSDRVKHDDHDTTQHIPIIVNGEVIKKNSKVSRIIQYR